MRLLIFLSMTLLFTRVSQGQWQPDLRLTNNAANSTTTRAGSLAASGEFVHVVWDDNRDGNNEIYHKSSSDGGITWGADSRLTVNAAASTLPSVSVTGLNVHIVWTDARDGNTEIYYKNSTDGGIIWGPDIRLTSNIAISTFPVLATLGSVVHVVWRDSRSGNQDIFYKSSPDGGLTWGVDSPLTNNLLTQSIPSVTVSGLTVHVTWNDNRDGGNTEIYYKRSIDGGTTWGADTRLTNDPGSSSSSNISVDGFVVHVFWNENRDENFEIYYKRSTDGGLNWGADTRLTNDPAQSVNPSAVASAGMVQLVWQEARNGNPEIYYKRSTDGGTSWSTDERLTNDPGLSVSVSVAVAASRVHIVWQDNRNTNFEVYYKQQPTGNSLPTVSAGNDTTIYYGYGIQQANLTATITGGTPPYLYLWSDGSTTQSITVSPSITTTFTVIVTDALGSVSSDNVQVNVVDVRCGNDKVLICHNGQTICVNSNSVPAHLRHGDALGSCENESKNAYEKSVIPVGYKLYPNYPNPFNSVTNIRFEVPEVVQVNIAVFDIAGKQVSILVNKTLQPGIHEFRWNASTLPSGVYYYRFAAGRFIETRKMIKIK